MPQNSHKTTVARGHASPVPTPSSRIFLTPKSIVHGLRTRYGQSPYRTVTPTFSIAPHRLPLDLPSSPASSTAGIAGSAPPSLPATSPATSALVFSSTTPHISGYPPSSSHLVAEGDDQLLYVHDHVEALRALGERSLYRQREKRRRNSSGTGNETSSEGQEGRSTEQLVINQQIARELNAAAGGAENASYPRAANSTWPLTHENVQHHTLQNFSHSAETTVTGEVAATHLRRSARQEMKRLEAAEADLQQSIAEQSEPGRRHSHRLTLRKHTLLAQCQASKADLQTKMVAEANVDGRKHGKEAIDDGMQSSPMPAEVETLTTRDQQSATKQTQRPVVDFHSEGQASYTLAINNEAIGRRVARRNSIGREAGLTPVRAIRDDQYPALHKQAQQADNLPENANFTDTSDSIALRVKTYPRERHQTTTNDNSAPPDPSYSTGWLVETNQALTANEAYTDSAMANTDTGVEITVASRSSSQARRAPSSKKPKAVNTTTATALHARITKKRRRSHHSKSGSTTNPPKPRLETTFARKKPAPQPRRSPRTTAKRLTKSVRFADQADTPIQRRTTAVPDANGESIAQRVKERRRRARTAPVAGGGGFERESGRRAVPVLAACSARTCSESVAADDGGAVLECGCVFCRVCVRKLHGDGGEEE